MSYAIAAEDMVGICLVLAEGNMMFSMEKVVLNAEAFQEEKKIHFGVGPTDFRNCLLTLGIETGLHDLDEVVHEVGSNGLTNTFQLPVLYWLPMILSFHVVDFNDEGEYWSQYSEFPDKRKFVHAFMAEITHLNPGKIIERLDGLGFNRDYLARYTEYGCYLVDDDRELPFEKPHWSVYPSHCLWSHLGTALQAEKDPRPKKDYFLTFSKSGVKIEAVDVSEKEDS